MKISRSLFVLAVFSLIFLNTSCLSMYESLKFNEDGSGEYSYQVDMSELVSSLDGMKDMIGMMGMEEEGASEQMESFDSAMTMINTIEMDTLIHFRDMPDEMKQKFSRPELADVISIGAKMSASQGVFEVNTMADFQKLADVPEAFEVFNEIKNETSANLDFMSELSNGMLGDNLFESFWTVEKNKIVLSDPPSFLKTLMNEGLGAPGGDLGMGGDDMEMASMLYNSITMVTEIELPGKIKSTTFQNAVISGNKVTLKFDIEKAIEDPESVTGEIKFKMPKAWKKRL